MLTAIENRIQAAKARRLSNGLTDAGTIEALQTYALECDAAAITADAVDAVSPPEA
ncbi:hypothetical protein [Brevundimonas sp.]